MIEFRESFLRRSIQTAQENQNIFEEIFLKKLSLMKQLASFDTGSKVNLR